MTNMLKKSVKFYDQLVQVRTRMAKKLGYENYIELGYYRMMRFDYNKNDVENYRKQVLEDVVPLDNELYARQQKRLGYDTLHAWEKSLNSLQEIQPLNIFVKN